MVELIVNGCLNRIKFKSIVDIHNSAIGPDNPVLRIGSRWKCRKLLIEMVDISVGIEKNWESKIELINECLDGVGAFLRGYPPYLNI